MGFQFYDSTIKSPTGEGEDSTFTNFNSTIVRLKVF